MKKHDDIQPNYRLKSLILEVVDNQIRDNDPPITNITYKRLMKEGNSSTVAKEKIGVIIAESIYDIMKNNVSYDEAEIEKRLTELT